MPTSTPPAFPTSSRFSYIRKALIPILAVLLATVLYITVHESEPASPSMKKFLSHLGGSHQEAQQQQPVAPSYGDLTESQPGIGKRNVGYFVSR